MPVAIPANISSVIYVQLRMVAAIARIGGYDPSDDEVRTMAYVCITGTAAADILKKNGIVIGEKGAINLVKLVPVAGSGRRWSRYSQHQNNSKGSIQDVH